MHLHFLTNQEQKAIDQDQFNLNAKFENIARAYLLHLYDSILLRWWIFVAAQVRQSPGHVTKKLNLTVVKFNSEDEGKKKKMSQFHT